MPHFDDRKARAPENVELNTPFEVSDAQLPREDALKELIRLLKNTMALERRAILMPCFLCGPAARLDSEIEEVRTALGVEPRDVIVVQLRAFHESIHALEFGLSSNAVREKLLAGGSTILFVGHDYQECLPPGAADPARWDELHLWRHAHDLGQALTESSALARLQDELTLRGKKVVPLVTVRGDIDDPTIAAAVRSIQISQFKVAAL